MGEIPDKDDDIVHVFTGSEAERRLHSRVVVNERRLSGCLLWDFCVSKTCNLLFSDE